MRVRVLIMTVNHLIYSHYFFYEVYKKCTIESIYGKTIFVFKFFVKI